MAEKININIGKVIYNALGDLVGNKCYPIVAENTTTLPFICYDRTSSTPRDTKDRHLFNWQHLITIRVVTEGYDEGVELATQVIDKIYDLDDDTTDVSEISVTDDYQNNAYIQNLTIMIKTL